MAASVHETHRFRPFEYMAWAKAVAPGAPFPMHISGLPAPPAALLPPPTLGWEESLAPCGPLLAELTEQVTRYLAAPACALVCAAGASEAIFLALAPYVERGTPVLVEQPAYRAMERVTEFLGGVPVRVERHESEHWRLDPERLDAALAHTRARVVAITDPHNPTGTSLDPATRAALIEVIERRGALLVVDEIFAPFRGPDRPPAWAAYSDRVLTLGSLTKGWGLASLRVGWVLGAPSTLASCRQVFDLLGVNPPSATLALAARAFTVAPALDAHARAASEHARAVVAATDWGAASSAPADDGLICFLRLPDGWCSEAAATALRALDGVQVVPGHFFGSDAHLRIGFAPGAGFDPAEGCRRIAARLNDAPTV